MSKGEVEVPEHLRLVKLSELMELRQAVDYWVGCTASGHWAKAKSARMTLSAMIDHGPPNVRVYLEATAQSPRLGEEALREALVDLENEAHATRDRAHCDSWLHGKAVGLLEAVGRVERALASPLPVGTPQTKSPEHGGER